jgi:hypothetical protein
MEKIILESASLGEGRVGDYLDRVVEGLCNVYDDVIEKTIKGKSE